MQIQNFIVEQNDKSPLHDEFTAYIGRSSKFSGNAQNEYYYIFKGGIACECEKCLNRSKYPESEYPLLTHEEWKQNLNAKPNSEYIPGELIYVTNHFGQPWIKRRFLRFKDGQVEVISEHIKPAVDPETKWQTMLYPHWKHIETHPELPLICGYTGVIVNNESVQYGCVNVKIDDIRKMYDLTSTITEFKVQGATIRKSDIQNVLAVIDWKES